MQPKSCGLPLGIRAGSQTPGDLVKIVLIKLLPVNLSPKKKRKKKERRMENITKV